MQNRSLPLFGLTVAAALWASGPLWAKDAAPPGPAPAASAEETAFLSENAAAMDMMMADMSAAPSGDVDVDFTAMMIPHHQGAIDMAMIYLRHGRNEQLRRLAQEIVVEQQQEIAAMRLALGQPPSPSAPVPTRPGAAPPAPSAPIPSIHDHSAMRTPMK
jgi:hypothetical protein